MMAKSTLLVRWFTFSVMMISTLLRVIKVKQSCLAVCFTYLNASLSEESMDDFHRKLNREADFCSGF